MLHNDLLERKKNRIADAIWRNIELFAIHKTLFLWKLMENERNPPFLWGRSSLQRHVFAATIYLLFASCICCSYVQNTLLNMTIRDITNLCSHNVFCAIINAIINASYSRKCYCIEPGSANSSDRYVRPHYRHLCIYIQMNRFLQNTSCTGAAISMSCRDN